MVDYCIETCGRRLSWLSVSFLGLLHVKYTASYRMRFLISEYTLVAFCIMSHITASHSETSLISHILTSFKRDDLCEFMRNLFMGLCFCRDSLRLSSFLFEQQAPKDAALS